MKITISEMKNTLNRIKQQIIKVGEFKDLPIETVLKETREEKKNFKK